jgi:aspartate aminotransferase
MEAYLENASWIRRLFEDARRMAADGGGPVYDLSIGNPFLEPPRKFTAALERAARDRTPGRHQYMSNLGFEDTRQAVADSLRREHGLPFAAEHIVMTTGAAGAVNVALKALIDSGDEVVVVAPHFVEYRFYIENHGGRMVTVRAGKDFDLDVDTIAGAVTPKTRVVLINNPNNPTGVVYPQDTLDRLGEMLGRLSRNRRRAIHLLDDAPYRKLVYDRPRCTSPFTAYAPTLMAGSHSKDLGIPGERVGFLAISPSCPGSDQITRAAAFANRTLGFINAPAIMQKAVTGVQEEIIDLEWYRRKRDRLMRALTSMGYRVPRPEGAFYCFPEAPGGDDIAFMGRMKSHRVLVVPGSGFGWPGHFRISYCCEDSVLDGALPVFQEVLEAVLSTG